MGRVITEISGGIHPEVYGAREGSDARTTHPQHRLEMIAEIF
jgi:hypothetical protein